MKLLVVYTHPNPDSFTAAVRDTALAALREKGHDIRLTDLNAIGFNPVMSREERAAYHTRSDNERPVAEHLADLNWCEGLIFIYPTWWYGPPAILKGWLERVLIPHVTFTMPEPNKPIAGLLKHIRLVGAITSMGSPWWWWTFGMRQAGRHMVITGPRALCAPACETFWLALHGIDLATADQREAFFNRIRRRLAKILP